MARGSTGSGEGAPWGLKSVNSLAPNVQYPMEPLINRQARCGAVSFVPRFEDALNRHAHLHVLVLTARLDGNDCHFRDPLGPSSRSSLSARRPGPRRCELTSLEPGVVPRLGSSHKLSEFESAFSLWSQLTFAPIEARPLENPHYDPHQEPGSRQDGRVADWRRRQRHDRFVAHPIKAQVESSGKIRWSHGSNSSSRSDR